MINYQLFLNYEVAVRIKPIRRRRKIEILEFLERLTNEPFLSGDFQKKKDFLDLEVKVFGNYSLYYYADHAVKEIKVVDFQKSKPTQN